MQRDQQDERLVARLQQRLLGSLQRAGITDPRVLQAFGRLPRHAFVDTWYQRGLASPTRKGVWERYSLEEMDAESGLSRIYQDEPLVTRLDASGRPCSSSSQPGIMAEMLEVLDVQQGKSVLEIGTGTGYHAALLAELTGAPWLVTTLDIDRLQVERAEVVLREIVGSGMTIIAGDGLQGYAPNAPYDRIIATGSATFVPLAWIEQLAPEGRLIVNLQRPLLNVILLIQKHGELVIGSVTRCQGMFIRLHDGNGVALAKRPGGLITPIIEKLTPGSFQPTNLSHEDFTFFLQCHLPSAQVYRMSRAAEQYTYLYDPETERVIRFDQDAVRGSVELWEQLCAIALAFQRSGMPTRSGYTFEISTGGQQGFRLGDQYWRLT